MLFLSTGCNKDKISLAITSPADGAFFSISDEIEVNVTATTKKGKITQVILFVDIFDTLETNIKPYNFIIPKQTFPDTGPDTALYFLSVQAYSSEGVQEGAAIYINVKK